MSNSPTKAWSVPIYRTAIVKVKDINYYYHHSFFDTFFFLVSTFFVENYAAELYNSQGHLLSILKLI